ncbi:MAG: hypothetical protein M1825_002610 [Sarcosagium campestre]|nr:MAG: hypothetical protein M1825_002610 [Sarcosagium campestre]
MPVHKAEENTETGITEHIAKNPSSATESTASEHPSHQDDGSAGKARAQDFNATPGPAIPQNMSDVGEPKSKEELRAKAAELNK